MLINKFFSSTDTSQTTNPALRKNKIELITFIIVFGFAVSVFFHYASSMYFRMGYPYNTFLFTPYDAFMDFFNTYNMTYGLNPYFTNYIIKSNYYPFLHIFFSIFTIAPPFPSFVVFTLVFMTFFALITNKYVAGDTYIETLRSVFILSFLTYPFLFLVDRGNIDGYIFILIWLAIECHGSEHKYGKIASYISLAMAIAMKVYPGAIFILFLKRKDYKGIAITTAITIVLTITSLSLFQHGLMDNFNFMTGDMYKYNNSDILTSNNIVQRGVSLFYLFKILAIKSGAIYNVNMPMALKVYLAFSAFLFVVFTFFVIKYKVAFWETVFIIVCSIILLPHISADYKLIFLMLPIYYYLNENTDTKFWKFYAICFSLLMIPKDYVFFIDIVSDSSKPDISISMIINYFVIFSMLATIAYTRLKRSTS